MYRVGVWFGFLRFALLLAVVLCWVDRYFDSWVLLGLFCLHRVTLWMNEVARKVLYRNAIALAHSIERPRVTTKLYAVSQCLRQDPRRTSLQFVTGVIHMLLC